MPLYLMGYGEKLLGFRTEAIGTMRDSSKIDGVEQSRRERMTFAVPHYALWGLSVHACKIS